MTEFSEQGIDLRPYIPKLWSKRYWIIGFGLLGAVLGLVISSLITPTYEATALVAATLPRERLEFDARIQTVTEPQPLDAYPDLAVSDALLVRLLDQFPDEQPTLTLAQLRKIVNVSTGSDPSIINLTVKHTDPAVAADMVNTWAEQFIIWANEIYGYQGDEQLVFFEARLLEAAGQLEVAEQALVDFQSDNRSTILENELLAAQQTQADYLAKRRQTELILQDVDSLLPQLQNGGLTDPIAGQRLTSFLLQVRALGGVSGDESPPFQLQLNLDGQADTGGADNRETIIQLRDMLVAQSGQIEERLISLEPQILALQQEKYQMEVLNNRLNRDLEVAEETYTTLARTVDEKRITSEDTTSGVKLAAKAPVPERPVGPNLVLNAIVAGMAGILLSIFAVILMYWWRDDGAAMPSVDADATAPSLSKGKV